MTYDLFNATAKELARIRSSEPDYRATVTAIEAGGDAAALAEAFDARWRQTVLDISPFRGWQLHDEREAQRAIDVKAYQAEQQRQAFAAWTLANDLPPDAERDEILLLIPPMQGESFTAWLARIVTDARMAPYLAERNKSINDLIAAGFDPQIFGVPMK